MSKQTKPKRRRGNPAWVKGGPSPNPGGRPRKGTALSERIRERIDPDELIDLAVRIAQGLPVKVLDVGQEKSPVSAAAIAVSMPGPKEQLAAIKWLADMGYFKPAAQFEIKSSESTVDYSKLTEAELATMGQLIGRACGVEDDEDDD